MKKYFKVDGVWSTGEKPDVWVAGTLSYSKKGLELKLLGNFRKGWSPTGDYGYSLIRGVVEKNQYGAYVLLQDCFTLSTTYNSSGVGAEKIFINRGIIGDDLNANSEQNYNYASLKFSHLQEWVGWRPFNVQLDKNEGRTVEIIYNMPEKIAFDLNGKSYSFGSSYSTSTLGSIHEASVEHYTSLVVSPIEKVSVVDEAFKIFPMVADLLTFATDRPNTTDQIMFSAGKLDWEKNEFPKNYYLLFNDRNKEVKKDRDLHIMDMLFGLADVQAANLNIFQNWFDFTSNYHEFCVYYFAYAYTRKGFVNDRFRTLVNAASIFCTKAYGSSEQTKSVTSEFSELLASKYDSEAMQMLQAALNVQYYLDLPEHLAKLFEEHKDFSEQLFPSGVQQAIRTVCTMISRFDSRLPGEGDEPSQAQEAIYLMDKLRWVLKIAMLKQIGFAGPVLQSIVIRNKNYNDVKNY